MLRRDSEESKRLDAQHAYMRLLAHGYLVQPSIPRTGLRKVADVGTGTGIWLREVKQEIAASDASVGFVGFDISPLQFPQDALPGVDFVVHSVTNAFPSQYHETFDLVHVRLLSYALKAQELRQAIENVIQILREPLVFLNIAEI